MKLTPKQMRAMIEIEARYPVGQWFSHLAAANASGMDPNGGACARVMENLVVKGYLEVAQGAPTKGKAWKRTGKLLGLNVRADRCAECLFSPKRIVSNDRAAEVLAECKRTGKTFTCHKSNDICCRGFYDANHEINSTIRLALAMNVLHFTDDAGLPVVMQQP